MAQLPQIPVVNAGALYVSGMRLSNNATTPNTLLNVAAGACRNSTNENDIVISEAVVISTGSRGALGLDSGTIANNTLYAVYAIGSSSNQIGNGQPYSEYPGVAMLSTNFTTPVLPQGYDMFRRIGAVRTDGAAAILKFYQVGSGDSRTMWYDVALATAVAGTNVDDFTAVALTGLTPAVATEVKVLASITPQVAGNGVHLRFTGSAAAVTGGQAILTGDVAAVVATAVLSCPQSAAASIDYVTDGTTTATLSVAGYVDQL